ncbi:MAG: hypothetical protein EPO25_17790 [Gammaproteobacteria bacterium]|nr:MAG: hypothetical protein EPO25_17790 [Gammaproteobacteria bacterium]
MRMFAHRSYTVAPGVLLSLLCLAAAADDPVAPATTADATAPAALEYPPARSQPPSFEHAQCANTCQIRRDALLTACSVPDNPNKPRYDWSLNCGDDNIKEYLACLDMCPLDTGPDDGS